MTFGSKEVLLPSLGSKDVLLPVRPCADWCVAGDGHVDDLPGDRNCHSDGRQVALSLEEPDERDGVWMMQLHEVSLRQERTWDVPRVLLWTTTATGKDTEILLTIDEAKQHALNVLAEVEAAEARGES